MAARWTIWDQESGLDIAICGTTSANIWLEITEPLEDDWAAIHTLRRTDGAFRPTAVRYEHPDSPPKRACPKKTQRLAKVETHFAEIEAALEGWVEHDLEIASDLDLAINGVHGQSIDITNGNPEDRALVHQLIGFEGINIRLQSARGRPNDIDTVEAVERNRAGETYAEIEDALGVAQGTVANAIWRDRKRGLLPPKD
jgi:hypothetical protein